MRAWLASAAASAAVAAACGLWVSSLPSRHPSEWPSLGEMAASLGGYLAFCFALTSLAMAWLERRARARKA